AGRLARLELAEDRGTPEVLAPAARAGRDLVALVESHRVVARLAAETPRPSEGPRSEAVQGCLAAHCADDNDLKRNFGKRTGRLRAINPQFAAHLGGCPRAVEGNAAPGRNPWPCPATSPAPSA